MNFEQVLELVKTVSDSELTSFQYEEGNQKITMQAGGLMFNATGFEGSRVGYDNMVSGNMTGKIQTKEDVQGNVVTSPLVGRFYTAPSEDAETFVKVGDTVKKGQVLAIVEAMKLMNEIESDYDGVVAEVLADNGAGVEYGQPLFRITA